MLQLESINQSYKRSRLIEWPNVRRTAFVRTEGPCGYYQLEVPSVFTRFPLVPKRSDVHRSASDEILANFLAHVYNTDAVEQTHIIVSKIRNY